MEYIKFMLKTFFLLLMVGMATLYVVFLHTSAQTRSFNSFNNTAVPKGEESAKQKEDFHFLSRVKEPKNNHRCGAIFRQVSLKSPDSWQTPTCKTKRYTSTDIHTCLQQAKRSLALGGDSRMRQVYKSVLNLIRNQRDDTLYDAFHRDDFTNYLNIQLQFHWLKVADEITTDRITNWLKTSPENRPDIFIFGMGPWYLYYETQTTPANAATFLSTYQSALQNLSVLLNELDKQTPVIWFAQGPADYSHNKAGTHVHTMEEYNNVTEATLKDTRVTYWQSTYDIASLYYKESPDFVHYSMHATDLFLDILLNYYCNSKMNLSEEYCCASLEEPKPATTVTHQFSGQASSIMPTQLAHSNLKHYFMFFLMAMSLVYLLSPKYAEKIPHFNSSTISTILSILAFTAVVSLCYAMERFSVLPSEDKRSSPVDFHLATGAVVLLVCFTRASGKQLSILHRDQTDEWKGWMQLVVVIYHVTGSSEELAIYMQLRFIASSYLVLNGYGHCMFHLRGGSLSLSRLLQVVLRMNLLCAILCVVMQQPYQFYYFVPLVTFWHLFVWLMLALPPRVSEESLKDSFRSYMFLFIKLLVVVYLITSLHLSESFFELVFTLPYLRPLFVDMDGSLDLWRFRWSFDRFSALFGVLLGIATTTIARMQFQVPRCLRFVLGVAALLGLLLPTSLGLLCRNKQECNQLHSFLFVIPIVSFIYLRNITATVRQHYSWLMAWFGRMTLEMFLLQFHLWMSNDTRKVLRAFPLPIVNEAFLAVTLIAASSILHRATEKLTAILTVLLPYQKPVLVTQPEETPEKT